MTSACGVGGVGVSGFRVCAKRCDQCLFSSAKIVDDSRREQVLSDCARRDSHFVCHKFSIAEGMGSQVCCRGFYDRDPGATNLMRIAERLGAIEFAELPDVSPPSEKTKQGHNPHDLQQ